MTSRVAISRVRRYGYVVTRETLEGLLGPVLGAALCRDLHDLAIGATALAVALELDHALASHLTGL